MTISQAQQPQARRPGVWASLGIALALVAGVGPAGVSAQNAPQPAGAGAGAGTAEEPDILGVDVILPVKWLPVKEALVTQKPGVNLSTWPSVLQAYNTREGISDPAVDELTDEGQTPPLPTYDLLSPGRNLIVQFENDSRPTAILPLYISTARGQVRESTGAFSTPAELWPGTGQVRRYPTDVWAKILHKYMLGEGASESPTLAFKTRGNDFERNRQTQERPLKGMKILRFPQTWENIWQREVEGVPIEERLERLALFDEAFRDRIQNLNFRDEWCSRAEQGAYARFYYDQHARKRDQLPGDASIYWQLADYYERNSNYDAKLSVMLDAVRNEVPEAERQRFHFVIGKELTERARLYQDAIPHLDSASIYVDARLLTVRCAIELGNHEQAFSAIESLVADLDGLDKGTVEEFDPLAPPVESSSEGSSEGSSAGTSEGASSNGAASGANTPGGADAAPPKKRIAFYKDAAGIPLQSPQGLRQQALLLQARANVAVGQRANAVVVAEKLLAQPDLADEVREEAVILIMSMAVETGFYQEVQRPFATVQRFTTLYAEARRERKPDEILMLDYDPRGAQAILLRLTGEALAAGGGKTVTISDQHLSIISYAAQLDPLSAEAYLVHGMLLEQESRNVNRFAEALARYLEGLTVKPDDHRLRYQAAVLYLRALSYDQAERFLEQVLSQRPDFYAAMNRMGDLRLAQAEAAEQAVADIVFSSEGVTPDQQQQLGELQRQLESALFEAARYYASSLEVQSRQPQLKTSLASLYTRIYDLFASRAAQGSGRGNQELLAIARSYMAKARALCEVVMGEVEAYGTRAVPRDRSSEPSFRVDNAPPVLAFAVYAHASYELGKTNPAGLVEGRSQMEDALRALTRLREIAGEERFFPNTEARKTFNASVEWEQARLMTARIEANLRQSLRVDDFQRAKNSAEDLGEGWGVVKGEQLDGSFQSKTMVANGTLTLGLDKALNDQLYRVSREAGIGTLASFKVDLAARGDETISRGIHMTRIEKDASKQEVLPEWVLVLGFDRGNELFWDVMGYESKSGNLTETSLLKGGRQYVDPREYNAASLSADSKVTLALSRFVPPDSKSAKVEYSAEVNGFRIALDIQGMLEDPNDRQSKSVVNVSSLNEPTSALRIGMFVQGNKDSSGSFKVTKAEWVTDPDLASNQKR